MTDINWGAQGEVVYNRTYARTKPDGTKETWPETVERVVDGNLNLGPEMISGLERDRLIELMTEFKIIPAGRHLWASGVPGRQFISNCWTSGWTVDPWQHFSFTFLRLMEGGGVGSNYSNVYLAEYPAVTGWGHGGYFGEGEPIDNQPYHVHIVCDREHPDYQKLFDAGVLSLEYVGDWSGAFEVEDSREGWADALVDLMQTYYRPAKNQNRVFDVSRVRGEGSRLKTFGGRASGPLPLALMLREVASVLNNASGRNLNGLDAMAIDHSIAKCVVSGGNRRSARMSIMKWDDPQVFDFIDIKSTTGEHWTTNISVEVDSQFWRLVDEEYGWAVRVLDSVAQGMLSNGEPGIWNSTLSNYNEPHLVTSTNPCAEQVMEEFEACNLGHVNLAGFVNNHGQLDWIGLAEAHRLMTRFLIRATFSDISDPKSRAVVDRNRRIGVGHLGVASFLSLTGTRFSDAPGTEWFISLLESMARQVDKEAVEYSHWLRIPVPVKKRTVAPTGSIAKLPGVSEGIHPIFAKYFIRRVRFSDIDPDQMAQVEELRKQGYKVEPCQYAPLTTVVEFPTTDSLLEQVEAHFPGKSADIVESVDELSLADLLEFQELYQSVWADNAVSFTANLDPSKYTVQDVVSHLKEYGPYLKGTTCFPELGMPQSPYQRLTAEEYQQMTATAEGTISDSVDEECASGGGCPIR